MGLGVGLALLVASCVPLAQAAPMTGALEYSGRYTRTDNDGRNTNLSHAGTLRLVKNAYLWEPWFAQVKGELGLSLTRSESSVDGETTSTSTGESVLGRGELALFPSSRFPFRLWLERRDTRLTDDSLVGVGATDRTVTRTGLQQRYRTLDGASFGFRLEETVVEKVDDESQRDERLDWTLEGQKRFDEHNVGMQFEQDRTRQMRLTERVTERSTLSIRHHYTPDQSGLRVNNLATLNRRELETELGSSQLDRHQLSSTALWTSGGERRVRVSGSVRAFDSRNESGGNTGEQRLLSTSVGAGYRYSDHWNFTARSSATVQETDREGGGEDRSDRQSSQQHAAQANYRSGERFFAGVEHRWDANVGASYRTDDDQDTTSGSVGLGQSFDRLLAEGGGGSLRARFRQSATHTESSFDGASSNLQNSASLRWDQRLGEDTAYGELQATDSRQFSEGELDSAFQLVNLQMSLQRRLSPDKSFYANATLQASRSGEMQSLDRRLAESAPLESTPSPGGQRFEFDDWTPSTSLSMVYHQRGLFGLYRLSWRSDLRYTSDNLLFLVRREDDLEERESVRWENRLEYDIGLLTTRFTATLAESDGVLNQVYRLTLNRRF